MQLIHLRENGYDNTKYNKKIYSYLPDECEDSCLKCGLRFREKSSDCRLCDSVTMKEVTKKIVNCS